MEGKQDEREGRLELMGWSFSFHLHAALFGAGRYTRYVHADIYVSARTSMLDSKNAINVGHSFVEVFLVPPPLFFSKYSISNQVFPSPFPRATGPPATLLAVESLVP